MLNADGLKSQFIYRVPMVIRRNKIAERKKNEIFGKILHLSQNYIYFYLFIFGTHNQ